MDQPKACGGFTLNTHRIPELGVVGGLRFVLVAPPAGLLLVRVTFKAW